MKKEIDQIVASNVLQLYLHAMDELDLTCKDMADIVECSESNMKKIRQQKKLDYVKASTPYILSMKYNIPLTDFYTKDFRKKGFLRQFIHK